MKKVIKFSTALVCTAFFFAQNVQAIEISKQYINNNRSHKSLKAIGVVIHDTDDAGGTAQNNRDYFNSGYRGASAHYFVDWNKIIQAIPENEQAWHAGPTANRQFLSIEICVPAHHNQTEFNKAYNNAVDLAVDMCKRYGWSTSQVYSHEWCSLNYKETDHTDPVAYFKEYGKSMDTFKNDVARKLKSQLNSDAAKNVTKAANYLGNNVTKAQYILNCFGYNIGVDGKCGQHTTECIGQLQTKLGIHPDYLFGPTTIKKAAASMSVAEKGCRYNNEVRLIQYMLGIQPIDGSFGNKTYNAVISFQKNHGITPDGRVGGTTFTKMLTGDRITNNANTQPQANNTSTTKKNDNTASLAAQNMNKAANYLGSNAAKAQYILNCFGYNIGVDGKCGQHTTQCIGDLQSKLGIHPDYLFGPTTIKKAIAKLKTAEKGCSYTNEVKLIQYMLGVQPISGYFGDSTYNAVVNFQKNNGIAQDGRVGGTTFTKMLTGGRITNNTNTQTNNTSNVNKNNNTVSLADQNVNKAAKYLGSNAKKVQYILNCFGYNIGVDGVCGKHTTECIGDLQKKLGIRPDYLFGPTTIKKAVANMKTAERGCSYTNEVKLIQYMLGVQPIDGSFGNKTYNAVTNYQRNHGIGTDGRVGGTTFRKMLV